MQIPEYVCYRTRSPMTIDGRMDETAWGKAAPISLVQTDTGEPSRYETVARMLWDDTYLYVGFHCIDPDIWGTIMHRDGHIFDEEVVEIFLDADSDSISYVEIEVSPLNVLLDLYVLKRGDAWRMLFDWDSEGLLHAVSVDGKVNEREVEDRSWTVEMAIPLADIVTAPHIPPTHGDAWRVNLYRIDRAKDRDEYSAWSPTGFLNYHVTQRFGKLIFSTDAV